MYLSYFLELRKLPESDAHIDLAGGHTAFCHSITTKYYTADIALYPFEGALSLLPLDIKINIEGLVLYFNAKDRTFLDKLESYADFLESQEIEMGILLCDHIFDDEKDGVTYREAKQHSRVLDLIELNPESDADGGYPEVHRAFNNTIWTNMNTGEKREPASAKKMDEMTEEEMEKKLGDFERIMEQALTFRATTADMGRNERLAYAQKFADVFEDIFGEFSDDEAGDSDVVEK